MRNRRKHRRGPRIEPRFEEARSSPRAEARERNGGPERRRPASRRRGKRGHRRGLFRRLFYWGSIAAVWAVLALGGVIVYYGASLPPISSLEVPERAPNVSIIAANGQLLATRGIGAGNDVQLDELPDYLPQAIVAIEDRRFRWHFGVDPVGLARALMRNVMAGRVVEGGSTLTQQLAKNLFLEPDRTIRRKVQEMILAVWLEANHSKDEILELYLNRVYFGAGTYGVEQAAQRFFDKSARAVTLSEAAVLAGLLKAPSRYAPTRNPALAEDRAELVISAMQEAGYLTPAEARSAVSHPARLASPGAAGSVDYVADWVGDLLPGYIGQPDQDVVVEVTLDPEIQDAAERALTNVLDEEGGAVNAGQGAVVVLDTAGAVKAMVGGRNYLESQFNRATKALRQPGSAFKPFVYVTAMQAGLTPETVREDRPVRYGNWSPSNYNNEHQGPVRLRQGLAQSINTVAVQLADEVGVGNVIDTARRMGISSSIEPNLSIALGTSEVTLLDLTGAYVPFANGGTGVIPHIVRRVKSADGKLLYERRGSGPGRVMSLETVGAMNDMMTEALATGTARRAAFGNWPAAGKTGTTQDWRDAWFVGYTADLVAGVWLGNDDSSPMKRVSGGGLPAMVWHRLMADAHQDLEPRPLPGNYWRDPDLHDQPAIAGIDDRPDRPVNLGPSGRGGRDGGGFVGRIMRSLFGG